MLLTLSDRTEKLRAEGVPTAFLNAMAGECLPEALQYVIANPEPSYWYYERHPNLWQRYKADSVSPIGTGGNGDEFFDLISVDGNVLFTRNELEGEWEVIGKTIAEFSIYLGILAYELHDKLAIETIAQQFESIGLSSVLASLKMRGEQDA